MPASTYGLVGQQASQNGQTTPIRLTRQGAATLSQLNGRHYEQAKQGNLFYAATAVTGVAPGTAIGTTAAFALYNPASSGVDLVVLRASMEYLSGTLGIGVVDWVANISPSAAAVTGTAITPVNAYLGGRASVAAPKTTATLPATPTLLRHFGNLPPMLATSVLTPWLLVDDVNGAIIVSPGCSVSLEATAAAGTSPLVLFDALWEEIPV